MADGDNIELKEKDLWQRRVMADGDNIELKEKDLRQRRGKAKTQFTRKVKLFNDRLDKEDMLQALKNIYFEIEQNFKLLESVCEELINFYIDNDYEQSNVDAAEIYLFECEQTKCDIYSTILRYEIRVKEVCVSQNNHPVKLKIEAMKLPRFTGNIREFPGFIDDFSNIVVPSYGENPAVLKQCLEGDPLKVIIGCERNYQEIMTRLKTEYGDPRKLVDDVMNDLKQLRFLSDQDDMGFIDMVHKVEKCYLDLKKVNLESEMNCVNIVSMIETILPREQKRRWILRSQSIAESKHLFTELLGFLISEKGVIEYSQADIRCGRKQKELVKVNVCNESESQILKVIKKLQEDQSNTQALLNQMCLKIGHVVTGNEDKGKGKWCWVHEFNGHDISSCGKFRSLSANERMELAKKRGVCFICLEVGHISKNCDNVSKCTIQVDGVLCNRRHHTLLHDAFAKTLGVVSSSGCSVRPTVLLDVSTVYTPKRVPIKILWDSGSNISLITHKMAQRLAVRGIPVSGTMTKVGNVSESFFSKEYCIQLLDREGNVNEVIATGIDEIAGPVSEICVSELSNAFPGFDLRDYDRPSGEIDMLIGTDYSIFLPRPVDRAGKLELTENIFGFSIRGCMPSEKKCRNVILQAKVNRVDFEFKHDIMSVRRDDLKQKLDEFFTVENIGITCKPQCVRCLCNKCPISEGRTLKEEREFALIERGLQYNEKNGEWIASYPWIKDPELLPNNFSAVFGRLKSTEKRLLTDNELAKAYKNEIKDMLIRGVARKLDNKEINEYVGPIHYIAHHSVLKPDSTSTPLRIVFDSSTHFMGHRLNDYWAKGPNILNSLIGILLRFRCDYIGLAGDISKMYHSIKLQSKEEHVHRFLWRDMDLARDPDQYVLTRVTFGDRPSGVIATTALRYTSEMYKGNYPLVAKVISEDTYMDDILTAVDSIETSSKLALDIEHVLSKGGFKIKSWIMSGDCGKVIDINLSDGTVHKILGMQWSTLNDEFFFKVKVNFSERVKKVRSQPDLTAEECQLKFPVVLTRRMVLSQIASIYDPLGFILPYILKAKILMRSLITSNVQTENNKHIDWDEPICHDIREEWKSFFVNLYDLQKLTFPRCVKPSNAVGCPILIIFSDASTVAYGCCVYIQWLLDSGEHVSKLVTAKNRIAPSRQITIPRMELCGAVLASRLRQTVVKEMKFVFEEIVHIVDSTIVRSQIQKESHCFKTFVATRVAEIQSKTDPKEWWWTESANNVADMVTKPCDPTELGNGSIWQVGPQFLSKPRALWPIFQNIERDIEGRDDDMKVNAITSEQRNPIPEKLLDIDISRYSTYDKLIRVTARILSVFKCKSIKAVCEIPTVETIELAERMWIMEAQRSMIDWETCYKSLGPSLKNGIIVVGCRIQSWLKDNWNRESYILLPYNHPLSKLIVTEIHYSNHEGVETTLAKLLTKYWIPGARRLIKSVKAKCVFCRKLGKKLQEQCMGQISDSRLKPSPPFYHVATDIFGPFAIRDSVKRRNHGKCFGVIFTCLSSRAVHLDVVENYSTDAFICALQRFMSIRGYPSSIHSDNGTQMIAANKELIRISEQLNKKHIQESANNKRISWSFNRSSDAPWLNGACESLIKSVKISVQKAIGESVLTYAEFQTVLFEVADLINNRPIGVKPGYDIELGVYLCPNDLLLGRNNGEVPLGYFDEEATHKKRFYFVQNIVSSFWKRWQRDCFPMLIVRKKWHTKIRNVQVGDVVLIQDSNIVRGTWKMGEIVCTERGRDSMVRDVTVRYKICSEGSSYKGEKNKFMKRSVHRLVVLLPVEER